MVPAEHSLFDRAIDSKVAVKQELRHEDGASAEAAKDNSRADRKSIFIPVHGILTPRSSSYCG